MDSFVLITFNIQMNIPNGNDFGGIKLDIGYL